MATLRLGGIAAAASVPDNGGDHSGGGDYPDFASVSLLIDGDATPITDITGKHNVRTVGNVSVSTFYNKYGTGSVRFRGNNTCLSVPENGTDFTFGTGDFTVETWLMLETGNTTNFIFSWESANQKAGKLLGLYYGTGQLLRVFNGSTILNAAAPPINQWAHVAIVRHSGVIRLYIDGTQEGGERLDDGNFLSPPDDNIYIGGRTDNVTFFGYLDDFRITKGIAVYTADFTPPTEALPKY